MTNVNASIQHDMVYVLVFYACHILRHIYCTLCTYITSTLCFSIIPLLFAIANAVPPLHCGTLRGGADKSLARPTSRCRRTGSIVSLERGVCSCAELQVFSCYKG